MYQVKITESWLFSYTDLPWDLLKMHLIWDNSVPPPHTHKRKQTFILDGKQTFHLHLTDEPLKDSACASY